MLLATGADITCGNRSRNYGGAPHTMLLLDKCAEQILSTYDFTVSIVCLVHLATNFDCGFTKIQG